MDLGYDIKIEKTTERDFPLIAALRKYWGRVEFIAFPIDHAGTTITRTLEHLTAAFSIVRPTVEQTRVCRSATSPATDHNAITHDFALFMSSLDSFTNFATSCLICIIRNRKRLTNALLGGVSHRQANLAASLAHPHAAQQKGAATHTHMPRTTRDPESTAIT